MRYMYVRDVFICVTLWKVNFPFILSLFFIRRRFREKQWQKLFLQCKMMEGITNEQNDVYVNFTWKLLLFTKILKLFHAYMWKCSIKQCCRRGVLSYSVSMQQTLFSRSNITYLKILFVNVPLLITKYFNKSFFL